MVLVLQITDDLPNSPYIPPSNIPTIWYILTLHPGLGLYMWLFVCILQSLGEKQSENIKLSHIM